MQKTLFQQKTKISEYWGGGYSEKKTGKKGPTEAAVFFALPWE